MIKSGPNKCLPLTFFVRNRLLMTFRRICINTFRLPSSAACFCLRCVASTRHRILQLCPRGQQLRNCGCQSWAYTPFYALRHRRPIRGSEWVSRRATHRRLVSQFCARPPFPNGRNRIMFSKPRPSTLTEARVWSGSWYSCAPSSLRLCHHPLE